MKPDHTTSILNELVTRVAHVRRRLVVLAVLRGLAMIFLAGVLYLLAFAWLDHHLHFSVALRGLALGVLVAALVGALYVAWRRTSICLGLKHAAGHIESAKPYHQQLLAVMEYHQQPVNYPYSQSLAHTMVRQLWTQAKDDDFSATAPAWKLWLFGAVFLVGLIASGWLAWDHYEYLSRYAARLSQPTAALAPLPATRLKSLDGDIAVEPNETVTLRAAIEGRLPQAGTLVIEAQKQCEVEIDESEYDPLKVLSLQPIEGADEQGPLFQGVYQFDRKGAYRYQFTAVGQETSWHTIRVCDFPQIEAVTVKMSFNTGSRRRTIDAPVTDFAVSALAGSQLQITIQASCPLSSAEVKGFDDKTESYDVNDGDRFTFVTKADKAGRLEFRLRDTQGLWSRELPPLQIQITEDRPPKVTLRHPEGDGFATNVASVPIEFEIQDDFGLSEVSLHLEFGNGRTECIPVPVDAETRTVKIEHVLELEEYDLDVGDAILFYASAMDIATGPVPRDVAAQGDVTFLEIKPYRKRWIQRSGGGAPCPPGQGPADPSLLHDSLLHILEYTRAFLKKTWRLANQGQLDGPDPAKTAAIAHDIEYAGENLKLIRDDSRYGFTSPEIEAIAGVLDEFTSARNALLDDDVAEAIPPETRAYRAMRQLVSDKIQGDLCSGGGGSKETPDRLELKEVQHLTRLEQARVAWQLNAVSQQVAEVAREQEALDRTFKHFLEVTPASSERFEVNDEKSWTTEGSPQKPPTRPSTGSPGQPKAQDRTIEGALRPKMAGASSSASRSDIMKVLRAHQRRLRNELSQLEGQLTQMPIGQDSQAGRPSPMEARKVARDHLDRAQAEMNRFETLLAEQYFDRLDREELAREAPAMLAAIGSELMLARQALQQEATLYAGDETEQLKQMALNMQAMADAYEKAVTPEQRRQLLNALTAVANQFNAMSGGPANIPGGPGPGHPGPVLAVKGHSGRDIVEAAKFAARQFLSRQMEVTKRDADAAAATGSGSLKFYNQENDFFESTAKTRTQ